MNTPAKDSRTSRHRRRIPMLLRLFQIRRDEARLEGRENSWFSSCDENHNVVIHPRNRAVSV